jgi:DNA-directed RNA polymerase specialized sigma24 family protein
MKKIEDLEKEYVTITEEDDDVLLQIKRNLRNLREPEKLIFLKYLEKGTYVEVARLYNVSKPTAKAYIEKIKIKLIKNINKKLI